MGAYYVVSEMLTNAAKHAQASVIQVAVEVLDGGCTSPSGTMASAEPTQRAAPGSSE